MDTPRRTLAKAATWQTLGLISMALLGALLTGSAGQGAAIALVSTAMGTVNYIIHERVWARIRWGRSDAAASRPGTAMLRAART